MVNKIIKLSDFKINQYKVDQVLDSIGEVELKEVFFDNIIWTTPKAILLKKGNKTAWVARSVIESIDLAEDDKGEPKSLWLFKWANLDWKEQ